MRAPSQSHFSAGMPHIILRTQLVPELTCVWHVVYGIVAAHRTLESFPALR